VVHLVNLIATIVRRFPWPTVVAVVVLFGVLGSFASQQVIVGGNEGFAPDAPELVAATTIDELFGDAGSGSVMQVVVSSEAGDVVTAEGLTTVQAVQAALEASPLADDLRAGAELPVVTYFAPILGFGQLGDETVQVVVGTDGGNVFSPEGQRALEAVTEVLVRGPLAGSLDPEAPGGAISSFLLPLTAGAGQGPSAQFVVESGLGDVMTAEGLSASLALQEAVLGSSVGEKVATDQGGAPAVFGFMTPVEAAIAAGGFDPSSPTDAVKAAWAGSLESLPDEAGAAIPFVVSNDADLAEPRAARGLVTFSLVAPLDVEDEAALAALVDDLRLPEGTTVAYLPPTPSEQVFAATFERRMAFLPLEAVEALPFLASIDADLAAPAGERGLVVATLTGPVSQEDSASLADELARLELPAGFTVGYLPQDPTTDQIKQAYRDRLAFIPLEFADQVTSLFSNDADLEALTAGSGLMVILLDDPSISAGGAALEAFSQRQKAFVNLVDGLDLPVGYSAGAFSFGLILAAGDDATSEIGRMFGLAAAIIVVVLLLNFWVRVRGAGGNRRAIRRTLSDTGLTLVTILIAISWMQGAGVLLGPDYLDVIGYFNPLTQILPILIIGLGVDYGIHMTSRYREELAGGAEVFEATRRSIRTVGVALVLATATTVVGFLTNLVSPVPALTDFGILASVGILSAFVLMLTFVPAIRLLLDRRGERAGRLRGEDFDLDAAPGILLPVLLGAGGGLFAYLASVGIRLAIEGGTIGDAFSPLSAAIFAGIGAVVGVVLLQLPAITGRVSVVAERFAWGVVVVALVLGGLGELGRQQLETAFSFTDFVPIDDPLVDTFETLTEDFGGGFGETTNILVGGAGESIASVSVHNAQVDAWEGLGSTPDVLSFNGSPSVEASPIRLLTDLLDPGSPLHSPEFATRAAALGLGDDLRVEAGSDVGALYDLMAVHAPTAVAGTLLAGPAGWDAALWTVGTSAGESRVSALRDNLTTTFGPVADAGAEVVPTSEAIISSVVVDALGSSQLRSLLITVLAATALLIVTFWVEARRPILGVITILPVALVLLLTFGVMALRGIPFGPVTATISALAVGIGVPFTIHITHRFLEDRVRYGSTEEAIRSTTRHTGGALAGSAFTTMAGFGSLVTSNLVPFRQFGEVTFWAILFSLLGSLVLLPSMLVIWDRWHRRRGDTLLDVAAVEQALDLA
jgi:uncharacterized protein